MEEDLKKLDDLFDSILEEIIHPEKAGTFRNPFIEESSSRISGLAESMILISVRISPDNMQAVCTVSSGSEDHKPFTANDIMREASSAGVFCGIDEAAVNRIADEDIVNTPVVIARGTPPINGTDGYLKMKVNASAENGTNIGADTEVCHVIMPKPGRDGMDVRGRVLPAAPGKEAVFETGEGIYKRGSRFYSECMGRFVLRDGKYCVINEKVFDNNIEHSMGVVEFEGSIVVNGDVQSRSVIRAGGSVTVHGKVISAVIEAGRNVIIDGKTEDTSVSAAEGTIRGKEFYASTLVAGERIIGDIIEGCTVKCVYGIDCLTGAGRITGGEVMCTGNINCLLVGNRDRLETRVVMGSHDEYSKEAETLENSLRRLDRELSKIMHQVSEIREREKEGTATLEDESFLEAALRIRSQKVADKGPLVERLKKVREIINIAVGATLRAKTMVYGGTVLEIGGFTQIIHTDRPHPTIKSNGSAIVIL